MKVLFVFAHPDDESFSSGGTIAKLAVNGHVVKLITATRGEAGSVGNPPLCTQKELGRIREKELRNAAKILGISEIFLLGYKDGSLNKIPVQEIGKKIQQILEKEKPDMVITFNKEGDSRHPDHIVMNTATTLAFYLYMQNARKQVRLYYADIPKSLVRKLKKLGTLFTWFGKVKGTKDDQITTIVDVSSTLKKKIKAFQCHQTQRNDWEQLLKLPELHLEFFTLAQENELAFLH